MTKKLCSKTQNFKILRNDMNEKACFEIILKRCEHVTCVTVRTISMITNQNRVNKYLLRYFLFLKFLRDYLLIG